MQELVLSLKIFVREGGREGGGGLVTNSQVRVVGGGSVPPLTLRSSQLSQESTLGMQAKQLVVQHP